VRRRKTLEKIRAGKMVAVAALGHFHPPYVTLAAHYDYDCIWLDLEHRAMGQRETQALAAFCHLADIDLMIRSPSHEPTKLNRCLEDGASGIMLQMIDTPEQAERAVQYLKFPPLGNRGIDAAGLDCNFTLNADENYTDDANRETFICAQIETPLAVENADSIAAVEGIDILLVGAGDLGLRIGKATGPVLSIDESIERIAAATSAHGKTLGAIAIDRDGMKKRHDQGTRFLVAASEFMALKYNLENNMELFKDVAGQ